MNRTTEKIPTWSLAYIINGDATALTDDEVQTIDRWMKRWQVQDVSPLTDEEGNAQPYFTHYPLFGLPTEVERTIQMFLEQRAAEDELFAQSYRNPAKNINDCVTYILNYVQKSGCNGFSDGEIYGQAIHYYDENEIEVGKPIQCQVVVNHVVELTEEEKQEARRKAVAQYQQMELQKLQNRNKPTAKKETQVQPSLFDF